MIFDLPEPRMGWDFVRILVDENDISENEAYEIANAPELTDNDWTEVERNLGRGMVATEAESAFALQVLAAYYGAKHEKRLNDHLVLEYRCRVRRCLLLHCWVSPRGRWLVLPPYRWSKTLGGDGTGRRPARAIDLERTEMPLVPLDCEHISIQEDPRVILADAMLGVPRARHDVRYPRR